MRGLEVHLNGSKLCTAGIGPHAVLNTIVDVVGRKDEEAEDEPFDSPIERKMAAEALGN